MSGHDPNLFDIDVDLSPLLGTLAGPTYVDARWYELLARTGERDPVLHRKLEETFRRALLRAQWSATARRALDRRRALRVPLVSRVYVDEGRPLVATDISLAGLRCSGRPTTPLVDIEFRLPGLHFPIETRAEVVSFKDASVLPLVGLRFVRIDRPYVELIADYVSRRSERLRRAA